MEHSRKENCVLGIDVGGTKVRFGLVNEAGEILCSSQYPSQYLPADLWVERLLKNLEPFLQENLNGVHLQAIGLGVRGSIDSAGKQIRTSSVIHNSGSCDICDALTQHLGVPAFIDNDVKAVSLSELLFGENRNNPTFACINVGTGLAMGLVIEGSLIRGRHNNAGEIGNMLYERWDTGEILSVETVASGWGMEQERKRVEEILGPIPCGLGGKALLEACKRGDPGAEEVISRVIRRLALILLNLEASLDIGTYILVGGVMSDSWMRQRLEREIQILSDQAQRGYFRWNAKLKVPRMGPDKAGLCGAAAVAYYELRESPEKPG